MHIRGGSGRSSHGSESDQRKNRIRIRLSNTTWRRKNAFTSEADSTDNPNGYDKIQRLPNGKFRIDQEQVDRIENILDTSYMPFYLHDVRTNEILSFHAFFEAITDSFWYSSIASSIVFGIEVCLSMICSLVHGNSASTTLVTFDSE